MNSSLMLAGIQGEGIGSTADALIRAVSRSGYFAYGRRNFSSRIKGGPTHYKIDIGTQKVLSSDDYVDILIAFDQYAIELNYDKLKAGGLLIYDDVIRVHELFQKIDATGFQILAVPLTKIAKEHGNSIMKNTVALGFLGRLLGISYDTLSILISSIYERKGSVIVEKNINVLKQGYDINYQNSIHMYTLTPLQNPKEHNSMMGNEAIALGALMAGCRFMAAYPITPASEIMEYLTKKFPQYNGIMIQTEDEISAITMAIGASYGGCRSMTATSGPGISLKMEGIGLAGMIEVPLVIVDSQRGGPSTGLPTKHEQSDIQSLYYGPHGEIPSIILAPYSVEQCFYQTIEAFNLADQYQCPVFIVSDLTLSLSKQTIDDLDKNQLIIDRGKLLLDKEINQEQAGFFKRFLLTEDGISPRVIPGQPLGMHHVTGIEHLEEGKPNEAPANRKMMMDKRMRKLVPLEEKDGIDIFRKPHSKLLILSMGSSYGIIKRAVDESPFSVDYGMMYRIKPLPKKQLNYLFSLYDHILIVENNATAQLASIIKSEIGVHHKIFSLLKYDGSPFSLGEVKSKIEELI